MASEYGSIRLLNPHWDELASLVPIYGNWCGPDWSAGQRGGELSRDELVRGAVFKRPGVDGTTEDSPLDAMCKDHDLAYFDAKGQPDEAMQKLKADVALMTKLSQLKQESLPDVERTYSKLMVFAFAEKIWNFDLPALGYQLVQSAFGDLMASIEMGFGGIDDLIYTDQFGTTMSGSSYHGNVTGLDREGNVESMSYLLFTLTIAGTNRQGVSVTYYKDAYPAIHSITSLRDGVAIAGSETITTTLEDGSVFVQVGASAPVTMPPSSADTLPPLEFTDKMPPASAGSIAPWFGDEWPIFPGDFGLVDGPDFPTEAMESWGDASSPRYFAQVVEPVGPGDLMGSPSPPIVVEGDPVDEWTNATWESFYCDRPDLNKYMVDFCDSLL